MGISYAVYKTFDLIFLIIAITIVLTWLPVKWYNEPFKSLKTFSEFFLAPFRKIIPPIGMIDISPIIALFCLGLLRQAIVSLLSAIGL